MEDFIAAQDMASVNQAVDAMERIISLGLPAFFVLFVVVIIMALALGFVFVRYLTKDKDGDNQTLEELRGIRTEQKNTTEAIHETNTRNEDNYLALKTVIESTFIPLSGLVTAVEKLTSTVGDLIAHNEKQRIQTQSDFKDALKQTRLDFVEQIGAERATHLAGARFQFPADHDCRWRFAFIRPVEGRSAPISNQPLWHDYHVTGRVKPGGEVVRIITYTTVAGWFAILRPSVKDSAESERGWVYGNSIIVQWLGDETEDVSEVDKDDVNG